MHSQPVDHVVVNLQKCFCCNTWFFGRLCSSGCKEITTRSSGVKWAHCVTRSSVKTSTCMSVDMWSDPLFEYVRGWNQPVMSLLRSSLIKINSLRVRAPHSWSDDGIV